MQNTNTGASETDVAASWTDGECIAAGERRWVWTLTGIPVGAVLLGILTDRGLSVLIRLDFVRPRDTLAGMVGWGGILAGAVMGGAMAWLLVQRLPAGKRTSSEGRNQPLPSGMVQDVLKCLAVLVTVTALPYFAVLVHIYLYMFVSVCTIGIVALWTGRSLLSTPDAAEDGRRWRRLFNRAFLLGIAEVFLAAFIGATLLRYGGLYGRRVPVLLLLCLSIFPIRNAALQRPLRVRGNILGAVLLAGLQVLQLLVLMVGLALGYVSVP